MSTRVRQLSSPLRTPLSHLSLSTDCRSPLSFPAPPPPIYHSDFANGFLVAEMFSRYDSKNVTMHSFDTGSSSKARRGNWGLLQKYFRRKGYDAQGMTSAAIEDVIVCKAGAAVALLIAIYTMLTGREVHISQPRSEPSPLRQPAYRGTTAAEVLRGATREVGDKVGKEKDAKIQKALGAHHVEQQRLRDADPERFTPSQSLNKVLRGHQRQMGSDVASPKIAVKTITVKHINTNVTQLRAGKELTSRSPMGAMTGGRSNFGPGGATSPSYGGYEPTPLVALDDVVRTAVQSSGASGGEAASAIVASEAPAETFATALELGGLSEPLVVAVFNEIARQAAGLGVGVEQVTSVSRILFSALEMSPPTGEAESVFECAIGAFEALGVAMQAADAANAASAFGAAVHAPLANLLRSDAAKRPDLLRVVTAFHGSSAGGRIEAVRVLKLALAGDLAALVQCLSIALASTEAGALADMPVLLDLHAYYCMVGLQLPSPQARAAAAAAVRVLATSHSPAVARTLAPQLLAMRTERWLSVRAQVLLACIELLKPTRQGSFAPESEMSEEDASSYAALVETVLALFTADADEQVRCVGLGQLGAALRDDAAAAAMESQRILTERYMEVLFSLSPQMRATMLSWGSEFDVNDGMTMAIPPLASAWISAGVSPAIVRAVGERIDAASQDGIESAQLEVILQAIVASSELEGALEEEGWVEAFAGGKRRLEDYVFIALCDSECCEIAAEVRVSLILLARCHWEKGQGSLSLSLSLCVAFAEARSPSSPLFSSFVQTTFFFLFPHQVLQRCVFASQRLRQQFLGSRSLVGAFQLLFRGDGSGDSFSQETACAFLTGLLEDAPRGTGIVIDVSEFVGALANAPGLVPTAALESLFKLAASM